MAPLLKSCPEPYDETVGSSPPPMTRRLKSIVPVVPRVFERRKDKSPVQIPTTSSPIPSPKQDLVNLSQNIPRRESHSKSAQDLQNALPNCSESISGEITDVVQDTERAAAQGQLLHIRFLFIVLVTDWFFSKKKLHMNLYQKKSWVPRGIKPNHLRSSILHSLVPPFRPSRATPSKQVVNHVNQYFYLQTPSTIP